MTLSGLAWTWGGPPAAAATPITVRVGSVALVLAGEATREKVFFDLYRVAMYLPRRSRDVSYIRNAETAKAFRVEVLYGGPAPDEVPEDWRRELVPVLTAQQMARLNGAFQSLQEGDVILATFAPGAGSTISLNGRTLVSDTGNQLIEALIDLWLGRDPVSEDIKAALLGP